MKMRIFAFILAVVMLTGILCACSSSLLDPKNPVTITVWHYYNGAILNAFEEMAREFNETVGLEKGIIVEGVSVGNVSDLEAAVLASANGEVGSMPMPNIFASYADTAYEAEKRGLLADLGDYLTQKELDEYIDSYIEEGKIGLNGELRIFPIAKSTETLMLNLTDWQPFADAHGLSVADLATMEGLVRVSALYYDWTDRQTPGIPDDGRAFFGRDSLANYFIIGSRELGVELFEVENGVGTINIDAGVMRKLWDCYYVPYISGYFTAYGRYRSDDAKVGELLAYVGSTASANYFPTEVTMADATYPVTAKVLFAPHFEGGEHMMVQQGAGMAVTKGTEAEEYASVEFLKWFTREDNNILFSAMSGYMPVKKQANSYTVFTEAARSGSYEIGAVTNETIRIVFEEMRTSSLYTSKAFDGGTSARSILEYDLKDKAVADRTAVLSLMQQGLSRSGALARFDNDAAFDAWLDAFTQKLLAAAG